MNCTTTFAVATAAPRWTRRIGLRTHVEFYSQRRHDPRFRLASVRIPLDQAECSVDIDPAEVKAIVIGIGGRLMPAYNRHFHVIAPRPEGATELKLTLKPEWSWFTADLGPMAVTAEWHEPASS